jgi:hypothetical protein
MTREALAAFCAASGSNSFAAPVLLVAPAIAEAPRRPTV